MSKISSYFLSASIFTFFITGINIINSLKISSFLLYISVIFLMIAIFKKEINILSEIKIISYFSIFVIFIIIGMIYSFVIFDYILTIEVAKGLFHILIIFLIFVEIILLSKNNNDLPQNILWCFLFSVFIIPFIYFPDINKYFLYDNFRFKGLMGEPNTFSNFQIIPTILLLYFIIKGNYTKIIQTIISILFFLSIGLILWSGSRGGLLGIIISLIFLILLLVHSIPRKKITYLIILVVMSFPIGYYFMPSQSHTNIKARVVNIQTQSPKEGFIQQNKILGTISGQQDRLNIWKNSLFFIINNPLGYGFDYNKIVNIEGDNIGHRISHNFELQILLTGGIGLFIIINYILLSIIIRSIKNCYRKEFNEIHILLPIMIGLLISGLFLDALFLRWIWIIIALLIVYNRRIDNKNKNLILQ